MIAAIRYFLALMLLGLSPMASAKAVDWSRQIALSPIGGHVMGKPTATTRLIEFVSYTCAHCATFVTQASTALTNGWVRQGQVSVEVRNAVRDPYDLAAALMARCGGKDRFFGNHAALFANHAAWMARSAEYDRAPANPALKTDAQKLTDIAERTGLFTLMAGRGFSRADLTRCMNDDKAREKIVAMSRDALTNVRILGTPSFMLNGRLLNVHDWAGLSPLLPAASTRP